MPVYIGRRTQTAVRRIFRRKGIGQRNCSAQKEAWRKKSVKPYIPEKLVAVSRYQRYFPTLSIQMQKDVYTRMAELIKEEGAYCDKGNYKHMAQILTSRTIRSGYCGQRTSASEFLFRFVFNRQIMA